MPHEIVLFLRLVRDAHVANRLSYRRTRDKNLDTLLELGWLPSDMFAHAAALLPEQALGTPRQNRHPGHSQEMVCAFGTSAEDRDIYVKVTAVALADGAAGCVLSFHIAEKPFVFPFGR